MNELLQSEKACSCISHNSWHKQMHNSYNNTTRISS